VSAAYTIEAGHHYDTSIFSSWPHLFQTEFKKSVQFHEDCAYKLPAYNSRDINKLYGAAWGLRGAHWNSCRFGWYWDAQTQEMVLVAYCYDQGLRNQDSQLNYPEVARVRLGETVDCSIRITATDYVFHVTQGDLTMGQICAVPHSRLPCWGITLGLYFGGSQASPATMHVWVDTL
jgi:hypothetical protein